MNSANLSVAYEVPDIIKVPVNARITGMGLEMKGIDIITSPALRQTYMNWQLHCRQICIKYLAIGIGHLAIEMACGVRQ
jgi:hypothetical protein